MRATPTGPTMTEVPKIVHQRLRTGARPGVDRDHPQSDLLNAFAEQALSQTERENVLAHLALCAECRDIVVIALPPMTVPEPAALLEAESPRNLFEGTRRKSFLWPGLRWAALAAGIAVAVFFARPELQHLKTAAIHASAPAGAQSVPDLTASQAPVDNGSAPNSGPAKSQAPALQEMTGTNPNRSVGMNQNPASTTANTSDNHQPKQFGNANAKEPIPNASSPLIADAGTFSHQLAEPTRNQMAPIVRAKPPLDAPLGQSAGAQLQPGAESKESAGSATEVLKESPQWTIVAGALNRSLDGGRTWQTVLGMQNSLLCYASRGRHVWVAGHAGALLHSADGGATWTSITVSRDGQPLSADVTSISLQPPTAISLTTVGKGTWSSADDGKTWEVKP